MVSLIIPPGDQISRVNKMLTDEAGTASNIKSRVNRLSVLGAITSAQQKLKQYNKVPPNGLVIYCGEVLNDQGALLVGFCVWLIRSRLQERSRRCRWAWSR